MQITAATSQEKTVVIPLPNGSLILHVTLFLHHRFVFHANALIFISRHFNFLTAVIGHIEQKQMLYRRFLFARHLIFISFQSRTGLRHRVDYPQFLYSAVVGHSHRKMAGVGRP